MPEPGGDEFSRLLTLLDPELSPEEQLEQGELRELLLEAIETLPLRTRLSPEFAHERNSERGNTMTV